MNRTDRLIAIVLLLHSRKLLRAREIAEHFKITIRTVYRDMKALNEAGVPIAAESGEGYSLVAGYHLPPVMFTTDEAGALYVGAELAKKLTDTSLQQQITSALTKILAILPEEKREYLERLHESTEVAPPPTRSREGFRDDVLKTLQDAVVHRRVAFVEYYSGHRDSISERKIEPLGLIYYSHFWHLIAYCRMRREVRDFRTDRIKSLVVLDEIFPERKDFSLQKYIEEDKPLQNAVEVKIKFKQPVLSYVRDRYFFGVVAEESVKDGLILTFMVPSLDVLTNWLLSFGEHAEVISPAALKGLILEEARRLVAVYSDRK